MSQTKSFDGGHGKGIHKGFIIHTAGRVGSFTTIVVLLVW